ncbi:hypothetical protein P152DRAFT_485903 [Eremomyces bilateralis CBS 781.70]|uniref:MYND-type domain-containing protein n=1 Tax=Eremomyces bilateralis CBS 781.70 TaxID=1392243 RepID=A0A6G1FQA6_9PEZI|nr:uncharacterized protein P152DRAFT_485903 [Eremomyces bilateralis CBS 781.70]KAF1807869.1 hypothetical protein P152DRAFT_485903 [Eremomyces bilateralis CBS 781.70]
MARVSLIPALLVSPNSSDAFEWSFPPNLESEITTLAAWCQVKQKQRAPLSFSIEDSKDDLEESTDDEECTNLLIPPSLDGDTRIKKDFLDRLAELLCYRKDPSLITSTAFIYSEMEVTIVAARNSTSGGKAWSDEDIKMLEYLAEVLERVSADDTFEPHPLPALQSTLVEYYSQRIRHHAQNAMSIEKGNTGLNFFKDGVCNDVVSGNLAVYDFARGVEAISYSTDFYTELKVNLTPENLGRVVEELAHIRRPMQGAGAFLHVAQQCPGFRNVKIVLLNSLPARKVKIWPLPKEEFPVTPRLERKFRNEVKKRKNLHAEMVLMAYLLGSRGLCSEVFPYLGVSKKTCLLCGYLLREIGFFETRGNHGKCYSQWTFPRTLRTNPEVAERLRRAVQRLRDILWDEGIKCDVSHRGAEKESVMAVPVPTSDRRKTTLFNSIVEDPRFLARETEWLAMSYKRDREANMTPSYDKHIVESSHARNGASVPEVNTGGLKGKKADAVSPTVCAFCKATCEFAHICKKYGVAAYCTPDCYRSDWHRHKFSCSLGRPTDATDYLVLACHANKFPLEDDVANRYGFMYFASGHDRWRLFKLYRRLVVDWRINEDELRSAVERNKLQEMLTFRCLQTGDPGMLRDMQWLKSEEGFGTNSKGPELAVIFEAAQRELLSPDENEVPIVELQPLEKRKAFVFYVQIRNGFKPDVDEDNWISLGFCTAADPQSEQRLVSVYGWLVERCPFDEFWNAMVESRMVELFRKYGLADRILHLRNFKNFMAIVKKRHQSVWELKRFTLMNVADPFRAVVVDYGFMNCKDARQRMQLRAIYQEYFERGEDEMRLHEACIAGKLGSFLESVLGSLAVRPDLLRNSYPLENCPLMGMVTDSVIVCPKSVLDQVNAFERGDGEETMVIPDAEDEAMIRCIYDRAAFLGTEVRKRYYSGSDGKVVTQLAW